MDNLSRQLKLIVVFILVSSGVGLYFGFNSSVDNKIAIKEVAGAHVEADPNHPTETYYGKADFKTLDGMLRDLNVTVYPEDKAVTFPPPDLGLGSRITITRATPAIVTDAKITKTYRTWAQTIKELLTENNIELLGKDSATPTVETAISPNIKIKITRVAEVEVVQNEDIPFKTVKKNSVDLEKGQTRTDQKGKIGQKAVTYLIKRVDGEEVSKKVTDTKIVSDPVTEMLTIGIGPKLVHSGPYIDFLNAAAKQTLVNATALQCLMLRESGGGADTGFPDAIYKGLFQYEDGFWASASGAAGFGGASIYDAKAQIFTTAYEIAHGQSRRWPPYAHCANL